MPDLLIKDVDAQILEKLKVRAWYNRHSLQDEIRVILEDAANFEFSTGAEIARKIKDGLRGREHSNSAELLREDRAR